MPTQRDSNSILLPSLVNENVPKKKLAHQQTTRAMVEYIFIPPNLQDIFLYSNQNKFRINDS